MWLAVLLISRSVGEATSCARLAPCEAVGPESILFIGRVLGMEPMASHEPGDDSALRVRLSVSERFAGLKAGIEEVTVVAGYWMLRGQEYLLDVYERDDGLYGLRVCGRSREVDESDELLHYLRARQKGQEPTSLTIQVYARTAVSFVMVEGAEVVARGPGGVQRGRTDNEGKVTFDRIPAGKYTLAASKRAFIDDRESDDEKTIEVASQSCASARIGLWPTSSVSGILLADDGSPLPDAPVELVGAGGERSHNPDMYETRTDGTGLFRFEHVLPGLYVLGTNIAFEDFATSNLPRAYFPGWPDRERAIEITVTEAGEVTGLQFRLPDVGPRRVIRICVIGPTGEAVPDARANDEGERHVRYGNLVEGLPMDEKGCVTAQGYERATYRVRAFAVGSSAGLRGSDSIEIPPGKGPANVVLLVRPLKP
jgi:hypothetical protein